MGGQETEREEGREGGGARVGRVVSWSSRRELEDGIGEERREHAGYWFLLYSSALDGSSGSTGV